MRQTLSTLKLERGCHAGLLLHRYLQDPQVNKSANDSGAAKRDLFNAAISAAANRDVAALYQLAFNRRWASWTAEPGPIDVRTSGRLIVGLGTENVLEAGIRLHHVYGMPIIPGSAIKGLAAHYCDQVWGERHVESPSDTALRFRRLRAHEGNAEQKTGDAAENYHRTCLPRWTDLF